MRAKTPLLICFLAAALGAWASTADAFFLVSSALALVVVLAAVFVAGFSLGVGQPLTMSLVSQKTVANERALAVSARLMGNRFGQFMVPAGAGAIAGAGAGGSTGAPAARAGAAEKGADSGSAGGGADGRDRSPSLERAVLLVEDLGVGAGDHDAERLGLRLFRSQLAIAAA